MSQRSADGQSGGMNPPEATGRVQASGVVLKGSMSHVSSIAPNRRCVSTHAWVAILAVTAIAAVLAACSGGDARESIARRTVVRAFTGAATAHVQVGAATLEYGGGECRKGSQDEFLVVNIGELGGDDYFGILVGRSPAADADTRSTTGGGTFSGPDVLLTIIADGHALSLRSVDVAIVLPPALDGGTFIATLVTGEQVSGQFSC